MKVMIIEDEPIIRRALVKMVTNLDIEGFNIQKLTEVEYAESAIPHLEKNTYDIVFVDIEGGEISGLDLIKMWHTIRRDTKWIIISGYDRFDYAQRAISYDVKEYLLKPITKKELANSVNRCIQQILERSNNFISTQIIDEFIRKLEDSIWALNEEELKNDINQWKNDTCDTYITTDYYNNVINHLLEILIDRLNSRGTPIPDMKIRQIHTNSKKETNQIFLKMCLEMIHKIKEVRKGKEVDPIEIAKQYILEHIEKDISLEDVANKLGFNTSYFSQVFKRKTGETFVKYRTNLRMERAKEILLKQDVRIIDIPFMIGLNDHPHFTKTFKEHTGYTPSGYRQKMGIR